MGIRLSATAPKLGDRGTSLCLATHLKPVWCGWPYHHLGCAGIAFGFTDASPLTWCR